MKDRIFFFMGNENLSTKGTDVLGISDYWRQQGEPTVLDRDTTDHPFIVKTDVNLGTSHRASVRFDRSNNTQTNQGGALQVLSSRQTFGGPVWTVVGGSRARWPMPRSTRSAPRSCRTGLPSSATRPALAVRRFWRSARPGPLHGEPTPGPTLGCGFSGLEAEEDLFIGDTLSFLYGKHQVKVGVTAAQVRTIIDSLNVRNGAWTFTRDLAFDINDPASYPDRWSGGTSIPNYSEAVWGLNAFAQDSWRVRDDLTLNIGIRYDIDRANTIVNGFIDAKNDQIVSTLGGQPFFEPRQAQHNVSPRIGVVWSPREGMTFRGAAGVFYDMSHNNYAIFSINNSLLAEQSVSLIANSSLNNPFWRPSDPAGSARELRAYLARNFPYWPDLSLVPATKQTAGDCQRHEGSVHASVLRRRQLPVLLEPDGRRRCRLLGRGEWHRREKRQRGPRERRLRHA